MCVYCVHINYIYSTIIKVEIRRISIQGTVEMRLIFIPDPNSILFLFITILEQRGGLNSYFSPFPKAQIFVTYQPL